MALDEQEELPSQQNLPDVLRDPWGTLRRRWIPILLVLVAGLAATTVFVILKKPRYLATATVLVTSQQIRDDLVQATLRDDVAQRVSAMVGEILSREQLVRLIEKHDPYPELREARTLDEIATLVRDDTSIEVKRGLSLGGPRETANLLEVRFEAYDPKTAANFANDLASLLADQSIRLRTQQASLVTRFLRGELERAERELRDQSRLIREFKEKYRGELPRELTANIGKLDRLQQQRQSLAIQIAEANTQLATLTSQPAASLGEESPEARLAALRAELRAMSQTLTARHPDRMALERRIRELEDQIQTEGSEPGAAPSRSSLITAASQTLEELRAQLAATEQQLVDLDARVGRTPARQEELAALEEREGVLRESYLDFLRKVQEAELAESLESAQQGERVTVLERAIPPMKPTGSRLKYLAAGVVASLALALFTALVLESIDPVLVTADQLEIAAGARLLGTAPHIS